MSLSNTSRCCSKKSIRRVIESEVIEAKTFLNPTTGVRLWLSVRMTYSRVAGNSKSSGLISDRFYRGLIEICLFVGLQFSVGLFELRLTRELKHKSEELTINWLSFN